MSSCACSCKMMDECWVVVVYGQWDDEGVVVQVWRMERMQVWRMERMQVWMGGSMKVLGLKKS